MHFIATRQRLCTALCTLRDLTRIQQGTFSWITLPVPFLLVSLLKKACEIVGCVFPKELAVSPGETWKRYLNWWNNVLYLACGAVTKWARAVTVCVGVLCAVKVTLLTAVVCTRGYIYCVCMIVYMCVSRVSWLCVFVAKHSVWKSERAMRWMQRPSNRSSYVCVMSTKRQGIGGMESQEGGRCTLTHTHEGTNTWNGERGVVDEGGVVMCLVSLSAGIFPKSAFQRRHSISREAGLPCLGHCVSKKVWTSWRYLLCLCDKIVK